MPAMTPKRLAACSLLILIIIISLPLFKSVFKPQGEDVPQEAGRARWFLRFSVRGAHTTAYTEPDQAALASSGWPYAVGSVAVHPLNAGEPLRPRIPFGSVLYLEDAIQLNGHTYDKLFVNDTGDVGYRLWGDSPYWLDLYLGARSAYNDAEARAWGVRTLSYHWYEPWAE